jgi:hypothetical protein
MEDDNLQVEAIEDRDNGGVEVTPEINETYEDSHYRSEQVLTLGRSILRTIQEVHYVIKDSSLKKEQLETLLAYRDTLVSKLK